MLFALVVILIWVGLFVIPAFFISKRGLKVGRNVPVRCSLGHYYSTIWIPGISFKAIRLSRRRYQFCPVGRHWSITRQLFLDEERSEIFAEAARLHDRRIV